MPSPGNVIASSGVLEEGVQFIPKPFSLKAHPHKIRQILSKDLSAT